MGVRHVAAMPTCDELDRQPALDGHSWAKGRKRHKRLLCRADHGQRDEAQKLGSNRVHEYDSARIESGADDIYWSYESR